MGDINKNYLIKVVKDGKEEGFKITAEAWKLFKLKFDVIEENDSLIISLRGNDKKEKIQSFYDRLAKTKTEFTFNKNMSE